MKKNTFKLLNYAFTLFLLFICSCSTEETVSNQTLQAQTWFKKYEAESPNFYLFQNLEYNWNSAKLVSLEDGTQTIIVPVIGLKKSQSEIWEQKLYIYNQGTNNYKALVFEIYPDKNASLVQQSIDGNDFTGFISTWDLKKGLIRAAEFKNNQVVQSGGITVKSKATGKLKNLTPPSFDEEGNGTGGGGSDPVPLREVIVTNNSNNNGGGNIGYENLSFSGGGSSYNGNYTGSFVTYGGGGASNNANNSNNTEDCGKGYIKRLGKCVSVASLIEERIKDSLDPCPKAVLEKLKNATVCDIKMLIERFKKSNSIYNINIISQVPSTMAPAATKKESVNNYTIYISTDYVDKTNLFIAASILHETIHAYFMSLFDEYHNGTPSNSNIYNDYVYLFNFYVTKNRPESVNSYDVHHQQMATDYVDAIARSLEEYQTGIAVPSTSKPNQIYSDLAWGGLSDAPVFNTDVLTDDDRERIINRYSSEQTGHSAGEGKNAQTPIGKKCN